MSLANLNWTGWILLGLTLWFTLGVTLVDVPAVAMNKRSRARLTIGDELVVLAVLWTWLLWLMTP